MQAGRELDALISEHVMGFPGSCNGEAIQVGDVAVMSRHSCLACSDTLRGIIDSPHTRQPMTYSTDFGFNELIIKRFLGTRDACGNMRRFWVGFDGIWWASFDAVECFCTSDEEGSSVGSGPTKLAAICIAALKAVGVEVK